MTSVERVVEYTEVKSEAPWKSQQEPLSDWPSKGQVTFNHVNMSYSPNGPLVLKDISFTLQPGEKVRNLDKMQLGLLCRVMDHTCWQFGFLWIRLVLWVELVLGRVLWSLLCSVWWSLRGRSTSMEFRHQKLAFMNCARRCPSFLRYTGDHKWLLPGNDYKNNWAVFVLIFLLLDKGWKKRLVI